MLLRKIYGDAFFSGQASAGCVEWNVDVYTEHLCSWEFRSRLPSSLWLLKTNSHFWARCTQPAPDAHFGRAHTVWAAGTRRIWVSRSATEISFHPRRQGKQRKYEICKGMTFKKLTNPSVFYQIAYCSYQQSTATCSYIFTILYSASKAFEW